MPLSNISYCNFNSEVLEKLKTLIVNSKNIFLLPHFSADGDALGSCAALKRLLVKIKKNVEIICPNEPKTSVTKDFKIKEYSFKPDLIIALDSATKDRIFLPAEFEKVPLVNIDHHPSNPLYADINLVEPTAASAGEVLAVIIFKIFGEDYFDDIKMCEYLLFAILDDSICFKIDSSSKDTLLVASFLISKGADFKKIKKLVSKTIHPSIFKIWSELICQGELYKNKAIFITISHDFLKKRKLSNQDFAGFINHVSQIINCEIVALIIEISPGIIKTSMRSKKADVNKIAKNFGGGGHKLAAGFLIENINLKDLKSEIVNLI